jgi:Zn-dependent M28 family amino/carboxypeptidase
MKKTTFAPLAALLAASLALAAPPAVETRGNGGGARLAARSLGDTPMLSDLQELCDRVGGRPTGSPSCERAVDWAAKKLKDAGVDVKVETYTVPGLWLAESADGSCLGADAFPLHLVAAPGTPGTPDGTAMEARVVDAGDGTAAAYARLGAKAKGAIALVETGEMRSAEDLFKEYFRNPDVVEGARKAGVAAVLLESSRPRGLLYRHPMTTDATVTPMPVALLAREDFTRLQRLARSGEARVRLALKNKVGPAYEARNVIGEIRGTEKPEEVVLLGAHLDSWELGTGANDNGVNAALVIDVARGMKALGLAPRRTVRFALFTGEEQGMWGSAGYVKRHAAEMPKHAAVVIFDIGSGRTTGFYLNGRDELRQPLDQALGAVAGLAVREHTLEAIDGTDNFDFLLSGVPSLVASQDWTPYLPDYHAASDTFDKVDPREARANAAIAAAVVWGLADSPEPAIPHQTKAEVRKVLEDQKVDLQMKAWGQWDDFISGKRGVAK